jgi:glycosyltransferase involved in cell wall biosynthesis
MSRRLLQAIAGAPHGGAETFFLRLAVALQGAGEMQRVLIRRDRVRSRALCAAGVPVAEFGFGGPFDLLTRIGFRREIARWRPTIVMTWMNRATRLCPHGDFVHVARLGGYYNLKYYRRCDRLIGNTRAIVDYAIAHGWPPARVHYLPNFVPDSQGVERTGLRARFATSSDAPLAVALGRLHPNKGFADLVAALSMTRDIHLWIAGEGPLRRSLERLAERLGVRSRVRFLGWREDVPAILAEADFLVCPSRHEPLGNVVIEGWAAGLPVVATASEGPRELITSGESGLLVPFSDDKSGVPQGLARALERLYEDRALRRRIARGGRLAYEAEFTEGAVVARYRQFFDEIAR